MSIEFNVNNEIKSAKNVYVGINNMNRKVIKVLTGDARGNKRIIYEAAPEPITTYGHLFKPFRVNSSKNSLYFSNNNLTSYIEKTVVTEDGEDFYNGKLYKINGVYINIPYSSANGINYSSNKLETWGRYQSDYHDALYKGKFFEYNGYLCCYGIYENSVYLFKTEDGIEWDLVETNLAATSTQTSYGLIKNGASIHVYFVNVQDERKVYLSDNGYTFTSTDIAIPSSGTFSCNRPNYNYKKVIVNSNSTYCYILFFNNSGNLELLNYTLPAKTSYKEDTSRCFYVGDSLYCFHSITYPNKSQSSGISNKSVIRLYVDNVQKNTMTSYGLCDRWHTDGTDTYNSMVYTAPNSNTFLVQYGYYSMSNSGKSSTHHAIGGRCVDQVLSRSPGFPTETYSSGQYYGCPIGYTYYDPNDINVDL